MPENRRTITTSGASGRRRRPAEPPTRVVVVRTGGGGAGEGAPPTPPEITAIERDLATVATLTRWAQGVVWGLGLLVALYLAGLLGYRNGFVHLVGMPELQQSATDYLADGVRMALESPRRVFDAGLGDTVQWLIAMFLAIVGGGAVALVILARDRFEEPGPVAMTFTALGAVVICVISVGLIGWIIARSRLFFGAAIPWDGADFVEWFGRRSVYAGLDLIGLVAAILWFVAAIRIRTWLWLRILTIVFATASLIAAFTAGARSNGALSQIDMRRTEVEVVWAAPRVEGAIAGEGTREVAGGVGEQSGEGEEPGEDIEGAGDETGEEEVEGETAELSGATPVAAAGSGGAGLTARGILIGHTTAHLVLLINDRTQPVFIDPELRLSATGRSSLSDLLATRGGAGE